uniref:Putative secreted protein n=1 Tax=Anopheles marajoara TaxID=58244 RepID=A0A2M4C8U7_9DIPT
MDRIEVSRLLLLCLLQLPPSVRYDHKFLERYSSITEGVNPSQHSQLPEELVFLLQSLVVSCQTKDVESLISVRDELCQRPELTPSQQALLKEVVSKYSK